MLVGVAAAMNANHGREGTRAVLGLSEVHLQVLVIGIREFNILGEGDVVWNNKVRRVSGGGEAKAGNEEVRATALVTGPSNLQTLVLCPRKSAPRYSF